MNEFISHKNLRETLPNKLLHLTIDLAHFGLLCGSAERQGVILTFNRKSSIPSKSKTQLFVSVANDSARFVILKNRKN